MTIKMFFTVLLVLLQLGSAVYTPGVYKTCLSCPLLSQTYECTTIAEIWPHEQCFTDVRLLFNGSRAYKFGYEAETDCLTPSSPHDRHRRMLSTSIVLCHECCAESLCNRRLCGVPGSNNTNLVCLMGTEVSGFAFDASITYCSEGERCYGERLPHARPNQPNYGNYGCASQAICDQLSSLSDDGPETRCGKCCSEDGCNAHVCQLQLQNPTETTTSDMGTVRSNTITMTTNMDTTPATPAPYRFADCWDLQGFGYNQDGVYDIYPAPTYARLRVRCDMTTDGGGWTVVQRRYDGSVNFTRTMEEYREGFGGVASEFWLGLESLHVLSSQADASVQLRVDLCTFDDIVGFAKYTVFSIADQNDGYRLNIGGNFTGRGLTDYMRFQNGRTFTITGKGAQEVTSGWWYYRGARGEAYFVNLNGERYNSGGLQGIIWFLFAGGSYVNLKSSEMKIRPVGVTGSTSHTYTCPS